MAKKATKRKGAGKKKTSKKGQTKKVPVKKTKAGSAKRKAKPRTVAASKASKAGTAKVPNSIGLTSQHLDFLTLRLDQVKRFYTDILGFRSFRHEPKLNYLFIRTTGGSSLGFMPPNPQMLGEQPPPKEATLYFMVENVDRVYTALVAKGLGFLGPPQEMPWGHRVITTTDPEGRTVMLASEIKTA
jgi:predicted enzyme related to lactoylglutathione lyase